MAEDAPRIPTPADFLGPWQKMAQQTEAQMNEMFNQVMGTNEFAALMGRYMEGYLAFQGNLARNVEKYMQSMNMPTRSDIAAIGERLAALEEQVSLMQSEQRRFMKRMQNDDGATSKRGSGRGEAR